MIKKLKNALAWRGFPLSIISDRYGIPGYQFVSKDFDSFDEYGFDEEHCIFMRDKFTWANIAAMIGLFPSVSMAKKQDGMNQLRMDIRKHCFLGLMELHCLFIFLRRCNEWKLMPGSFHIAPISTFYLHYIIIKSLRSGIMVLGNVLLI